MCISKILSLLKKKTQSSSALEPEPGSKPESRLTPQPSPKRLAIPHPEEAPDYSKTVENTDLVSALNRWEIDYGVPESYRDYWKTKIIITLDVNLSYPAGTYEADGVRHLTIRPEWVNSGIIAHEQAHNSYALLTAEQKVEFSTSYTAVKTTEPLIVLLYSVNRYGLTSDIEGHAEVYRYLGGQMPEALKKYYPKLF
jgi:hypothetical protein